MFRHTIPLLLLLVSSLLGAQADSPESPEALRLRIRQLESRLKKLRKIVEGTAKPINLARTSLATVDATPPNGGRPLNDPYYGILNAFDGGDNWHQGINYSYYLGNGSSANIVVQFDKPVTVTSIHIDGTCSFTTQLTFAKGGIAQHDRARGSVRFAEPSHGVTQMRLSLLGGSTPLRVEEVQILGHPNPAVAYRAQRPFQRGSSNIRRHGTRRRTWQTLTP